MSRGRAGADVLLCCSARARGAGARGQAAGRACQLDYGRAQCAEVSAMIAAVCAKVLAASSYLQQEALVGTALEPVVARPKVHGIAAHAVRT